MKALIDKTHKFLRRMRWKAHFFDNASTEGQQENFEFNSAKVVSSDKRHLSL